LETPTDEVIHIAHQKEMSEQMLITKQTEKDFKAAGYTDEQIERIKENARAAGLT